MKNKKITRKEFVVKTSKVAGGLVLCPIIMSALQSCSENPVSSDNSCTDTGNNLFATCGLHGARFNTDGCSIQGPAIDSLENYTSELNNNGELIIENSLIIDLKEYPDLQVGSAIALDSNEINNVGLLIYRKSENEFNVLSRVCTHAGGTIGAFQEH